VQFGSARNEKDAALWLCGQIGIDPANLGWSDRAKSNGQTGESNDEVPLGRLVEVKDVQLIDNGGLRQSLRNSSRI
jgi:hypothetical protein